MKTNLRERLTIKPKVHCSPEFSFKEHFNFYSSHFFDRALVLTQVRVSSICIHLWITVTESYCKVDP